MIEKIIPIGKEEKNKRFVRHKVRDRIKHKHKTSKIKEKRIKERKRGHVVKVGKLRKGFTKSVVRDRMFHALPPGKRISASGKVYYEYRSNHADANPRTGL